MEAGQHLRVKGFLFGGLTLLAFTLRAWGWGWSLPYVDHPDEPAVVQVLLRLLKGNLDPNHFFYPSLILYLQALVFKIHFWVGALTGLYSPQFILPRSTHFYTTIPGAFVWGRIFTASLGTLTVLTLALWKPLGQKAGLIGAALLALSPWAITNSHYLTVDIPAACFALLALLSILRVAQQGTNKDYLLAGILIGLATGSKYQNALLGFSFLLAHLRPKGRRPFSQLLAGGGIAILTFFLTSPYILLDFPAFRRDMQTLFTSYEGTHGDLQHAWPLEDYLTFFWAEALGPLPFLLTLVGGVDLVRKQPTIALVLLSFPLLLILSLLRMETHFYRNLLPVQAPLLLLAGFGATSHWEYLTRFFPSRWQKPILALSLLFLLGPSFTPALRESLRLAQPDSRVTAQEWLRQNYPGVQVAAELSHPLLWQGVAQATSFHYLPLQTLGWYREQGYSFLLTNAGRRKGDEWTKDYQPLLKEGKVLRTFGGRQSQLLGPQMDILETGLTPTLLLQPTFRPGILRAAQNVRLGPLQLLGAKVGKLTQGKGGPAVLPAESLRPGETLGLRVFWRRETSLPPSAQYQIFVHLCDSQGQTLAQRDSPPWQGLFPLQTWPLNQLVSENLDLALPPTLPAGAYRLLIGLYNPLNQGRYPALVEEQAPPKSEIDLGQVELKN